MTQVPDPRSRVLVPFQPSVPHRGASFLSEQKTADNAHCWSEERRNENTRGRLDAEQREMTAGRRSVLKESECSKATRSLTLKILQRTKSKMKIFPPNRLAPGADDFPRHLQNRLQL